MPHKDPAARAAWYREYYAKNRARILAKQKAQPSNAREIKQKYQQRHREKNRASVAATGRRLRQKWNEEAAGRPKAVACEVCGSGNCRICFDHDHTTGKFRGWLCAGCNSALGHAKDDPVRLRALADYLEQNACST